MKTGTDSLVTTLWLNPSLELVLEIVYGKILSKSYLANDLNQGRIGVDFIHVVRLRHRSSPGAWMSTIGALDRIVANGLALTARESF